MRGTRRAWQRPALRTDEEFEQHRPVSWLELFFDLVFVVVISRLAHHLAGHLGLPGVVAFAVQFLAVFWVWNGFTYYAERFESDGLENRLFAFLAIVPVAGLAVFGEQGLGATYVGFALAYLLARAVNQIGWARADDEPTHPRLSPGLKLGVAAAIGTLGVLDLGWNTHALLVLLLAGLAVPMAYGAFVWFTQPVADLTSNAADR